jgi:dTDP-4-dehydrorhamnose reductase
MRLFVTGLGGYLGRAIAAAAAGDVAGTVREHPAPPGTRAFRLDVRDTDALAGAVADCRPDAIVHTAIVQQGADLRSVNVDGSGAVARVARLSGLRLVHLSSDAIFSGDLGRPVREEDVPTPITPYGTSKADAELAVIAADPGAVLVRTSLIYGAAEPSKHERRALDGELTFYCDEIRCPIAAADLAAAVIELAALPCIRGPLNVAGADAVSRLEFARLIVAANGHDPATVSGASRPEGRPGDVRLDCTRAGGLLRTRLRGVRAVLAPGSRPGV